MASPDLALRRVHDNHVGRPYELTGLRTASIRDQMLRAQLLVERLAGNGPPATIRSAVAGRCAATRHRSARHRRWRCWRQCRPDRPGAGHRRDADRARGGPLRDPDGVYTRWIDPAEYDLSKGRDRRQGIGCRVVMYGTSPLCARIRWHRICLSTVGLCRGEAPSLGATA